MKTTNQQNPPLPKRKRVDAQGNSRKRVFAKSGSATLLLASGLTDNGATVFIQEVKNNAELLGGECKCDFLVTR